MGLFDELKNAASSMKDAFTEMAAEQAAAQRAAREALPLDIINPTPQDDIDAGAQRAVITWVDHNLESGDSVWRTEARLAMRARLAGGELGPETTVKIWTSSGVIRALARGWEIPVTLDANHLPVSLDQKAIAAELKAAKRK